MMTLAAVCVVVLALTGSFCDAQYPPSKTSKTQYPSYPSKYHPQNPQNPPVPVAPPPPPPPPPSIKQPSVTQQQKQTFETPITWKYPNDPTPEPKHDVPFELRYPVAAATVAVECRESVAHVEVKQDMFGIGQLVSPADLTLGNCGPVSEDTAAQVLIFEAQLQDCESTLTMTEDSLVYTFTVNYNPKPLGSAPVVRTSQAAVIVECHYPRNHNVSSLPIDPHWVPFSAVKMAEEFLYFTLQLMTDDWLYERPSHQYFLGDMIHIEVEVKEYFHVPLRVYVDECVATLSPDANSSPNYAFIDNHGCFMDGRITGSDSKFLTRTVDDKLQFQLEAFRFQGAESGVMYITCHLFATSAAYAIDSEHRACSYVNGWTEASGHNEVCGSCESGGFVPYTVPIVTPGSSTIGSGGSKHPPPIGPAPPTAPAPPAYPSYPTKTRKVRHAHKPIALWEGFVTVGPFEVEERKTHERKV